MLVETPKGKFPVKFGFKALRKFSDLIGKDMNQTILMVTDGVAETWKGWNWTDMYTLLYVGFWFGALTEGEECQISGWEEMEDLLDDEAGLLNKVTEVLIQDFIDMFSKGEAPKKK